MNIHFSHLNLIKILSIFEELNLSEYKSEINNELQELVYRWISERVKGKNIESFLGYLSEVLSKNTPFYQYAINEIRNRQESRNDISLSLQDIFEERGKKYPSDLENQYLMNVSVEYWVEYLQNLSSRKYLFDDIKWVFIQIKKGIFNQKIKENIFSAFDKLAYEDQILKKYFDNQKKRLLKEAGL